MMRTSIHFLCLVVLSGMAFSAPQQPATQPAQSLGDVARQDKAAAKPKAKRVITDDDIDTTASTAAAKDAKAVSATAADAKPASAAGEDAKAEGTDAANADAKADAKKDASTPDEKSKAEQLAALKKDQASLNSIIQQLEAKISNETDQNRIDTFNQVIARTRERIVNGQKAIDALEHPSATPPPSPPQ